MLSKHSQLDRDRDTDHAKSPGPPLAQSRTVSGVNLVKRPNLLPLNLVSPNGDPLNLVMRSGPSLSQDRTLPVTEVDIVIRRPDSLSFPGELTTEGIDRIRKLNLVTFPKQTVPMTTSNYVEKHGPTLFHDVMTLVQKHSNPEWELPKLTGELFGLSPKHGDSLPMSKNPGQSNSSVGSNLLLKEMLTQSTPVTSTKVLLEEMSRRCIPEHGPTLLKGETSTQSNRKRGPTSLIGEMLVHSSCEDDQPSSFNELSGINFKSQSFGITSISDTIMRPCKQAPHVGQFRMSSLTQAQTQSNLTAGGSVGNEKSATTDAFQAYKDALMGYTMQMNGVNHMLNQHLENFITFLHAETAFLARHLPGKKVSVLRRAVGDLTNVVRQIKYTEHCLTQPLGLPAVCPKAPVLPSSTFTKLVDKLLLENSASNRTVEKQSDETEKSQSIETTNEVSPGWGRKLTIDIPPMEFSLPDSSERHFSNDCESD